MNEVISIIVPVYNVEKYIKKCLDSLVNQTYAETEIVIVDDGSTDNSGKICDEYANAYKNVKVIHTENHGLSAARNEGMRNATGKYIGFVDSDDWVEKDMFEILRSILAQNDAGFSVCGMSDEYQDESRLIRNLEYGCRVVGQKEAFKLIIDDKNFYGYVCNKLFLKAKFSGLQFDEELLSCEDIDFSVKYTTGVEKVSYTTEKLYHYRHHGQSMTGDLKYNVRKLSVLDAYEYIMPLYQKYCEGELCKLQRNYLKIAINIKGRMKLSKQSNSVVSDRLEKIIEEYYPMVMNNSDIGVMTKINIGISKRFSGIALRIKHKIMQFKVKLR